jgi:hypothetical protein
MSSTFRSVTRADYFTAGALAFLLYLGSALILDARDATTHFGADTYLYEDLAEGTVLARVARFHPVTVGLATIWMWLFGWLSAWMEPKLVLKAMSSVGGAGGVIAAIAAFAVVLPRREAILCGAIYAASFGVWYFASIEESKIFTATLAATYIAIYLRFREDNRRRQGVLLIAVFVTACLNEITACFLAAIPAMDCLLRHRLQWRRYSLVGIHVLAGTLSLAILELLARFVFVGDDREGASHIGMFVYYFLNSDHGLSSFYYFASNWLFFNFAAPTSAATYFANPAEYSAGYFPPGLAQYFGYSFAFVAPAILAVIFVLGLRKSPDKTMARILLGFAAYSLVRAAFFFSFNPAEPLLFSPAVTLAHLFIVLVPFAQSGFHRKQAVLLGAAIILFAVNGIFVIGL